MASIYPEIRACLESHLTGVTNLPVVSWENVDFKPTTGTSFVRTQLIPTNRAPAVRGLNPQQRYDGIFSVFCYVAENEGPNTADDLAESILEAFEATTDISFAVDTNTTVIVSVETAERTQGYNEPPWYFVRVNINWYIYN